MNVLAVVVIVGDDVTRAALLSRLRGDGGRRQIPYSSQVAWEPRSGAPIGPESDTATPSSNQSVMAKSVKSNRSGLPFVSTISTP